MAHRHLIAQLDFTKGGMVSIGHKLDEWKVHVDPTNVLLTANYRSP